jgi:rhodanese-related sulfurtransferase
MPKHRVSLTRKIQVMATPTEITVPKLSRLIGTPNAPDIIDVRIHHDFLLDQRILPCATRRSHKTVSDWAAAYRDRNAVVVCQRGAKLSQGVAAWLRQERIDALSLEGGFEAWQSQSQPLVPVSKIITQDNSNKSVWVTRSRPKVDRIACPWLIRRFVDPNAVFLFVNPSEVVDVADRFGGVPFDIEGVHWSHCGELCTFDVMVEEFGLTTEPLLRLAKIVRGADTGRPDLAEEAAGLLAVSLGLSRMFADDIQQLDTGMVVYDALYRWCRDATDETHNWPSNKVKV